MPQTRYTVIIHRDEDAGGYWGECPQLSGCYTQAETIDELMANMKEAIELYLEEPTGAQFSPVEEIRELAL